MFCTMSVLASLWNEDAFRIRSFSIFPFLLVCELLQQKLKSPISLVTESLQSVIW